MQLRAWPLAATLFLALLALNGTVARAATDLPEVDAEIVLAVDVSFSMDPGEQKLQRAGYVEALTSPEFANALASGPIGAIALTYVEWSSVGDHKILVGWHLIDGPAAAEEFATELAEAPYRRAWRTSISSAIDFSATLFDRSGFRSARRIIDVSGDGPNNDGRPVTEARDEAVSHGIAINGLPLLIRPPTLAYADIENLDIYYSDCVIGGPGAFVIAVRDRQAFVTATRTKLVREIAGTTSPPQPRKIEAPSPRISCTIGESLFQKRFGN